MTTLHLGVIDLPYTYGSGSKTTGDVAEILEDKYHVMEHFYELHSVQIVENISDSLVGSFESLMSGAPPRGDLYAGGTAKIEEAFKNFLTNKEMDALGYPGVPTAAAQRGVSHRFKKPYKKRAPRPSFIDTGLYESSFKAWVD